MKFWKLVSPRNQKLRAEWTDDAVQLETVICPANSGHQRGGKRIGHLSVDLPLDFERDFIWTWYSDCLLTKRAVDALRKNRVTGFETLQVTARFRQSLVEPPELFELRVTGWAGIAPLSSGVRLVERCEHCGHLVYSGFKDPTKLFDPGPWDGSDFFMIWPLPRFIFLTERAKNVIERAGLEGAIFLPVEKLPPTDDGTLSPGRLTQAKAQSRLLSELQRE